MFINEQSTKNYICNLEKQAFAYYEKDLFNDFDSEGQCGKIGDKKIALWSLSQRDLMTKNFRHKLNLRRATIVLSIALFALALFSHSYKLITVLSFSLALLQKFFKEYENIFKQQYVIRFQKFCKGPELLKTDNQIFPKIISFAPGKAISSKVQGTIEIQHRACYELFHGYKKQDPEMIKSVFVKFSDNINDSETRSFFKNMHYTGFSASVAYLHSQLKPLPLK